MLELVNLLEARKAAQRRAVTEILFEHASQHINVDFLLVDVAVAVVIGGIDARQRAAIRAEIGHAVLRNVVVALVEVAQGEARVAAEAEGDRRRDAPALEALQRRDPGASFWCAMAFRRTATPLSRSLLLSICDATVAVRAYTALQQGGNRLARATLETRLMLPPTEPAPEYTELAPLINSTVSMLKVSVRLYWALSRTLSVVMSLLALKPRSAMLSP